MTTSVIGVFVLSLVVAVSIYAADTSNFTQVINAGTLAVDIIDGSYASVANPAVAMSPVTFDYACQSSTGIFGTATEQIYVANPDAADNGWNVTMAATGGATDIWDSAGTDFDFNDPQAAGCADGGADADSIAGQMTVDPSGGTIAVGNCATCTTTNISAGSSAAFAEGTTDSITLLSGASASDDIGDWTLQGVSISQSIPPEQPAASDYNIDMTLTIASL